MRVQFLLALFAVGAAQEEETCVHDSEVEMDGNVAQLGLLQLRRLREELSADRAGAGDRQSLLEMKAQLAAKLDSKEDINNNERGFLQDFIDFILNTSIPYIKKGAANDQQEVANLTKEVTKCSQRLTSDQERGEWQAEEAKKNKTKTDHEDCRVEEKKAWKKPNTTCTKHLDKWVQHSSSRPPSETEPAFPGATAKTSAILAWMKKFHDWHCTTPSKEEQFENKTEECKDDMTEANNTHKECNIKQNEFEKAFCTFRATVLSGCHEYETCRVDADFRYNTTTTRLMKIDQDRKVEWQILHVIICYIRLLLGDKKKITNEAKVACETDYPPFPTDYEIVWWNITNQSYVHGANATECISKYGAKVDPAPCTNGFILEYYTNGLPSNAAPATECSHSCPAVPGHPCDLDTKGGCAHNCNKVPGSMKFYCSCKAGSELADDLRSCKSNEPSGAGESSGAGEGGVPGL